MYYPCPSPPLPIGQWSSLSWRYGAGNIWMSTNTPATLTLSAPCLGLTRQFAVKDTLSIVSAVSYLPRGVFHTPPSVDLLLFPDSGPILWCLNSYWLEDELVQGEWRKVIAGYWKDNLDTADPLTEWETLKTTLRGSFMSITGGLYAKIISNTPRNYRKSCKQRSLPMLQTLTLTREMHGYRVAGNMSSVC